VCEVERHCLTPEVLLCIEGSAVCFVGKPTDSEKLYPEEFGAFYLEEKKGFLFNPRTWHAIPFPMTEKAVFWVIFREGTAQSDLEILDLEKEKRFRFQISVNTTE
jgi:ureidoglycolate hydrolase